MFGVVSDEEVTMVMRRIDFNHDQTLSFDEALKLVQAFIIVADVGHDLAHEDTHGHGKVVPKSLMTEQELADMKDAFAMFDTDGTTCNIPCFIPRPYI
jgi:hypothetical protein